MNKKLIKEIVDISYKTKEGHIASSLSVLDILLSLYGNFIKKDNKNRFILSKGHASLGLYTVLKHFDFLTEDLNTFCQFNSKLGGHPNSSLPCIEASTGSLGHGLPIAVGMAMAYKILKKPGQIYVLIGDGEMNEGSVWEAMLLASHHKLDNLTCVLDYNHSNDRALKIDDVANKIKSFNWYYGIIDGHYCDDIDWALSVRVKKTPIFIIADTIKGKGISCMENNPEWHHKFPNEQEYKMIMEELNI